MTQTAVILDNLRSVYNVASIFRTSDALGINKIYLAGITPTPTDKYGRPRSDFVKVALGAEKKIPWEYSADTKACILNLKKEGFYIVAIEQDEKSVDYKKVNLPDSAKGSDGARKVAFLIGTETMGIPKEILDLADVIAEIPMKGDKESLNVTIAFGIAAFRILDL